MTRRPLFLAACLLLAVLASACGSDTRPGWVAYEDEENGFALQHPETWEVKHGMGGLVTLMAPSEPGTPGRANVTVTMEVLPEEMAPEAYLEMAKPLLAQILPGYEFTGQEAVTVNGVDGVRYTYSIEIQEHRMHLVGYALLDKGTAYVLTGGALADRFESHAEDIESICRSMRIL